nr:MAG TPA: hypothetical protein [Caudoviricetes sp.]
MVLLMKRLWGVFSTKTSPAPVPHRVSILF